VLATIELAHAMVEYTRDLTLSDVKLGMLGWEWFEDYIQVNNGLYPNAYNRIPKLSKVNIYYPELLNA
jgi:predicted metal-dependent hydrolase